jgi:hypothetical protein
MDLHEVPVKAGTGPPDDDPEDLALPAGQACCPWLLTLARHNRTTI